MQVRKSVGFIAGGIGLMASPHLVEAGPAAQTESVVSDYNASVVGGAALEGSRIQASVDNPNSVEYWEAKGYGMCEKVEDPGGKTFILGESSDGSTWTILVLKAGSNESTENPQVEIKNPEENTEYGPIIGNNGEAKKLSYIIKCERPDGSTTTSTVHETTTIVDNTTTTEVTTTTVDDSTTTTTIEVSTTTTNPENTTTSILTTTTTLEGTTTTLENTTTTIEPDGTTTTIGETTTTLPNGTTTTVPKVIVTTTSPSKITTTTKPKLFTTSTLANTGPSDEQRNNTLRLAAATVGAGMILTGLASLSRRRQDGNNQA